MKFLKEHKVEIFVLLGLSIIYFISRLYHIMDLPIFTDEAIYVRWTQIAKNDAAWRFISLTDGKQPMFVWIGMILMKFIKDPLLASRCVSVLAGFMSTIGLFFLGREIFKNRWIGLISSAIYVIYPFGLVYDRMALYDSLTTAFTVWSLYILILLVRRVRLDIALIAGLVIGGGVLNKTNGFFNIYFLPATLILFDWSKKDRTKRLCKWIFYAIIVVGLVYLYYSILRLSPFFHIISEKDTTFIFPFNEWIHHPFTFLEGNLHGLYDWFISYFTYPVLLLVFASFFITKAFWREKLLLLFWFIAPFMAAALFGKALYPRYILPMTISLLPLVAFSLYELYIKIKKIWIALLIGLVCFALYFRADYFILTDFAHAPIAVPDLGQYINDWPAGGGVKETTAFFKEQAKKGKIYIGTEGTFGLMPAAYEINLVANPNVTVKGFWPIPPTPPKELIDAATKYPTYVVFYQDCPPCQGTQAPTGWHTKFIASYKRGAGDRTLNLYQILPQE
jgi:4-amino-4-deoxy-L-arabinose transferase-like glycosyltransferase